jgi:hypothetical protein
MKNLFLAVLALSTSVPAFAGEQYYCKGNFSTSESTTLFVKALSHDHAIEGEKMEYLIVIRDDAEEIFHGHVSAESEDVMLSFKSRRGQQKLSGMIYMDELNQTWMKLGNAKEALHFNCDRDAE